MFELQKINTNQNQLVTIYKPSELLNMFTAYLSREEANSWVIYLRGVYLRNPRHDPRWSFRYDVLRDEDTQTEITLKMTQTQSDELKDGNLVTVGGVLGRRVQNNSQIQLMLEVSRIEIMQEQVVDEGELKRIELRRRKMALGYRNVDGLLEQKLYTDDRPKVALVIATTSITMSDFNAGINAAKSAIDFSESRVNFSSPNEFSSLLKQLDQQAYDVIALVRGGGARVEAADDLGVLETIVNLKTPVIAAIGHVEEKLFIKQIVDKETPTPNGLGQYFSDMVESVSERKTKSRAVLTEKIKKQFQEQLEVGKKQNKELQEKLEKLTKAQEDANKKHGEQVQALTKAQSEATRKYNEQVVAIQRQNKEQLDKTNKQNEELQKKLMEITRANETTQKTHAEQLGKLQTQLKEQSEQSARQSKEFNESLKKMQETNGELNRSLQKLTAQNTQAAKDLQEAKGRAKDLEKQLEDALNKNKGCSSGCLGLVVAIISIASVACWMIVCIIVQ